MKSYSASIGGIKMRWEEEGKGIPLVLIHGIPTSPALWRYVVPRISGARCLAFEMVGYGQSIPEGRRQKIGVNEQADYIVSWLNHLGIERALFAGHDLGGGAVQIIAVRHSQRCAGLFLTNSISYDSWPIPSVKAMRIMSPVTRRLPDLIGKQVMRTLMYRGHDNRDLAREGVTIHWSNYKKEDGLVDLVRQMQALDVHDTLAISDELRHTNVPARVAWGDADQFQKLEYGKRLAEDLGASLCRIQGGKHFTPEDHPDIIADEINELIRTVH